MRVSFVVQKMEYKENILIYIFLFNFIESVKNVFLLLPNYPDI